MIENIDRAHGTHIDRRSLLKKAGAAGALGLAAPITFDSFFSPAAACSGPDITHAVLVGENQWSSAAATSHVSPAFVVPSGSLFFVVARLQRNTSNLDTVSLASTQAMNSVTLEVDLVFNSNNERNKLLVYSAVSGSSASRTVTVGSANAAQLVGHVIAVASPSAASVVSVGVATGTSATATVDQAPAAGAAQLFVVSQRGPLGSADTARPWSASGTLSELAESFRNNGDADLSLATFFTNTADTDPAATSTSSNLWAAASLELNC